MQKVYEFLIVQATTDDELIDRHLTCLAEKTVRTIVCSVIIDVVSCTEKW